MSSSKESMCDDEKENTNKPLWAYFVKSDATESVRCLKCSMVLKLSYRSRKEDL